MAQSSQPQNNNSDFNNKHPRGAGGKFGAKGGSSQQTPKVSPQTAAQLRDYQQRNNLPVTGTFDARTLASLRQQGATANDFVGSNDTTTVKQAAAHHGGKGKHGGGKSKAATATKHAAAAKKAAARKQAAAAKKAHTAKVRAARQHATAAKQAASSQAQAYNGLSKTQRAEYRKQNPTPPAGYTYASTGRLVSTIRTAATAKLAATIR